MHNSWAEVPALPCGLPPASAPGSVQERGNPNAQHPELDLTPERPSRGGARGSAPAPPVPRPTSQGRVHGRRRGWARALQPAEGSCSLRLQEDSCELLPPRSTVSPSVSAPPARPSRGLQPPPRTRRDGRSPSAESSRRPRGESHASFHTSVGMSHLSA